MTWYSLALAGDIKNISKGAWQLAWEASQDEGGLDHSNAIFKKVGPDNRLVLYFTPSSQLVAESFGARPCAKPSPQGMTLLAGSERAWQIHFGVFSLMRATGLSRALRWLVSPAHRSARNSSRTALDQHIRELFRQAGAVPQQGASMLLALALWATDNLAAVDLHELQPALEALRRSEAPANLDALLEETDQRIARAQDLHDAGWVLLRELADWVPAAA